jgi:iron only hydrogenase large subunit-like protein/uncharacterized Fe-S cluster-containing protein
VAVLKTNEANCRDCYACVRACPVKAIRVNTGHAEIVPDLCILDGACVEACPQGAKQIEEHLSRTEALLASGPTAFTVAPSIAAGFALHPGIVAAALRRLGAVAVGETSETSGWISRRHREQAEEKGAVISSSCPAVVNLATRYHVGALSYLATTVSPMVAHGRTIKKVLGDATRVVFCGPCIAKKGEITHAELADGIDAVLTFDELHALLDKHVPGWTTLAPEHFDRFVAAEDAVGDLRHFPLPGGMMKLLGVPEESLELTTLVITGIEHCKEFFADIPVDGMPAQIVEMMACDGGCIAGPAMSRHEPVYRRQHRLERFAGEPIDHPEQYQHPNALRYGDVSLDCSYHDLRMQLPQPSEDEIRAILDSIGKHKLSDELNCGACGYKSCRDKAVAVYRGMAEREMCIPHMRNKAESLAEVTIAATPTGVVVVNRNLYVLSVNPAAERMYKCQAADHVGRPLWRLFDPIRIEKVFQTKTPSSGVVRYEKQNIIVQEYLAYDAHNDLVIVLATDITSDVKKQEEFATLREASLERAQEVINKQMRVAQEIAGLLGETTAETKAILTELMHLFSESEGHKHGRG